MHIFSRFIRCSKLSNFYRKFVHDVKSTGRNVVALNIIGSGAAGESASVSVSVDNVNKYLFNCGEDFQRLFADQKKDLNQLKHIFVTQNKWQCIGGLSNVCAKIIFSQGWFPMFHGPAQLYKCIKRILCLSIMSELDFKPIDCNTKNFFVDDTLSVNFISIKTKRLWVESEQSSDKNEVLAFVGEVKSQSQEETHCSAHFLILDLPTMDHMTSFIQINKQQNMNKSFDVVVHFSPEKLAKSRQYQNCLSSLNVKKHVYLNESNEYSRLRSVYELQMKLNRIDENVHPPLKMPLNTLSRACKLTELQRIENDKHFYSTYYLSEVNTSKMCSTASDECITSYDFHQNVDIKHAKSFPKIVFLGTASARPSLTRNNTSILVHTTNNDSMLIDCGEGTCSQIHRLYGNGASHIIQNIRAVFLSHMHNDHHCGLPELLRERRKCMPSNRPPLLVLSSKAGSKSWLYFYDNNIEAIHDDIVFIENDNMIISGLSGLICKRIGVDRLQTCRVAHANITHALTLNVAHFKLTFSSDTKPCDELVALGQNSTLLVHEATYADAFIKKAEQNRHCTVSQAIEQSQKMNAKYTILTHFSHRNNFPFVDSNKYKNIGIAFDFMTITEDDLPKLSLLNRKHQDLFIKK